MAGSNDSQDPKDTRVPKAIVVGMMLIAVAVGIAILVLDKSVITPMARLALFSGYLILILVFTWGLLILYRMADDAIDLSKLVSEADGDASMSRFQLLIFTFVIALCIVMMVVSGNPPKFPAIPNEVLILLGISASTYAVSKGIQKSAEGDQAAADADKAQAQADQAQAEAEKAKAQAAGAGR
jgi:hypothetical protein